MDNFQGESPDEAEVTVSATVSINYVAHPDLWSLQLSSVKVQSGGKAKEVQNNSEPLFAESKEGKPVEYYEKPSHDHHNHHEQKDPTFTNILKSVFNLLQQRHSNDTFGSCDIHSMDIDGQTVQILTDCVADKELNKHSTHPLGITADTQRSIIYSLASDKTTVDELTSSEGIEYFLNGNKDTKSKIVSNLTLKLVSKETKKGKDEKTVEFLKNLQKIDYGLYKHPRCDEINCQKVSDTEFPEIVILFTKMFYVSVERFH